MADKDFAQTETSQFEASKAQTASSNKQLWISIIAIGFSIICFIIGFSLGEQHGLQAANGNAEVQFVATIKQQQQELSQLKEEAKQQQQIATSQVGDLTFYNELPQQSIVPEPLHAPKVSPHIAALPALNISKDSLQQAEQTIEGIIQQKLNTSPRSFRIQIASFKLHKEASVFQAKLKKIGLESTLNRVDLPNIGIWYRIYSTSFAKEEQAMHAKLAIKDKLHVTGIMIQDD